MEYRILGRIEVVGPGGPLELGTHKQRALLAALLVNANQVVAVDRVIDQLWGDEPPPKAISSLQAYISNLRRVLEPGRPARRPPELLLTQPPGYVLRVEPGELDVVRFEDLIADGQRLLEASRADAARAAIDAALAMWRGAPLSDFEGESFVVREVARLAELRGTADETSWEVDLALGRHAQVVVELRAGVDAEPLRERRWWLLMKALYRCGRQAEALRAYQEARKRLGEQLGIEPGPALQQLEREVLAQDAALEWRPLVDAPGARLPSEVRAPGGPSTKARAPLVGSPLVGRTDQLDRLEKLWVGAQGGTGALVLLTGEAGIGKTRLTEELGARIGAAGGRVAWGRCQEREGAPAYWPWLQVVRQVEGISTQDALARIGLSASDSPDRGVEASSEVAWTGVYGASLPPDAARFPVYDAMVQLLLGWAEAAPAVVVIEDVHWADAASLGVLELLAPALRSAALVVICTYRDADAPADHPLAATLAALAREPATVRLALDGLDVGEVAAYARLAADLEVSADAARRLHQRTEGNPFFLAELVRLLASEGRDPDDVDDIDVPIGVRDVIRRRLARLPDDVRSLLGVASVVGRDVDPDLLSQVCGVDADAVFDLLDTAYTTRLVRSDPGLGGGFRFTHALVRDTLYDEQTPMRRARLHARIGDTLRRRPAGERGAGMFELAYHYVRAVPAGRAADALEYARRAAEHADAQCGFEQAADLWQLALDAAAINRHDDELRYELLMHRAWAERRGDDVEGSFVTFAEAAELAEVRGDSEGMAVAVVAMGSVAAWTWRYNGDAVFVDLIRRALHGVGDDAACRALLLSVLADELSGLGEYEDAVSASLDALALADSQPDSFVQFAALAARAAVTAADADVADRANTGRRLVALRDVPAEAEFVAHMDAVGIHLEQGDVGASERELAHCEALAVKLRIPFLGFQIAANKTGRALLRGDFSDAENLGALMLDEYHDPGSSIAIDVYGGQLFILRWLQGRLNELDGALADMGAQRVSGPFRAAQAIAHFELGRPDDALRRVDENGRLPVRVRDFTWVVTSCLLADVVANLSSSSLADQLYTELAPFTGQVGVVASGVNCVGSVDLYLGRLAVALDRPADALRHFAKALEVNDRIGARPWLAWSQFRMSEQSDPACDEHRELLAQSAATAAELGMAPLIRATTPTPNR